MASRAARMQHGADVLLIVGAGMLGMMAGSAWLAAHPDATVVAETRSRARHASLAAAGMQPVVAGGIVARPGVAPTCGFPHVLFCAPPSGFSDYPDAVAAAVARTVPGGRFVLTSSAGVYAAADGLIAEDARLACGSPCAERLLGAERNVLSVSGGCVLRLSGLYTLEGGPYYFFLKSDGVVQDAKDGLLNMIHYEDAAAAAYLVLDAPDEAVAGNVFNVAGPAVMQKDAWRAARLHPLYANLPMPKFQESAPSRKVYDATAIRKVVGWKPKFGSMVTFWKKKQRTAAFLFRRPRTINWHGPVNDYYFCSRRAPRAAWH
jgi:nucleoside-diphosphate-sugar epimerase